MKFNIIISAAVVAAACWACGRDGGSASLPPDAVVSVGSAVLTVRDVRQNVPAGLAPDDSAKLANAYVRRWVDAQLLTNVAAAQVDMAEIDRLVDEYRRELIINSYRRQMAQRTDESVFAEDSLMAYYEKSKRDFVLERPLVKGVYLKVPDDAGNLRELRRLYKSEKPDDVDRLEKVAPISALHYDYFRDRWVDWEQIESRIPVNTTESVLATLKAHKQIDMSADGFVYLLDVTDYLPAGSVMPYEFARQYIVERMLSRERTRLDTQLRNELYERSVADGTVRFVGN